MDEQDNIELQASDEVQASDELQAAHEGINWKSKLTSRKLWVAVAGLVTGLIIAFGGDDATAETVSGCILAGASVIAYIVGEGLVDASRTE